MISVVIPLYNKESSIERTIASVLAQSVTDWELIIVDDGSTDNSLAVVRRFVDPRIHVVTQVNAGVSAARNHGVELSSNNVVAFVDADDYWDEEHLANIEQLIACFPDASIYGTAYFMVGEEGQISKIRLGTDQIHSETLRISNYFSDALTGDPPIHSSAVAVNKSAFQKIGGFPTGLKAGEDLITWARLACVGKVAYSNNATAYFVLPPISVARNRDVIRRPPKTDYVGNELSKLTLQYSQIAPSLKLYIGNWHRIRAILFMELGERRDCLSELVKAIRCSGVRKRDIANLGLLILPTDWQANLLSRWRQRKMPRADIPTSPA